MLDVATKQAITHTSHCLVGCGLGEFIGSSIGAGLRWSNLNQSLLAIALAFFFGYLLTFLGARRSGMSSAEARGTALRTDTISIISMETIDTAMLFAIPGAMNTHPAEPFFWISLALSLLIAFVITVPINRFVMIRYGIGHNHGAHHDHSSSHH